MVLLWSCFYSQITQLKINHNPFAKGFRDSGSGKREKRWVHFENLNKYKAAKLQFNCLAHSLTHLTEIRNDSTWSLFASSPQHLFYGQKAALVSNGFNITNLSPTSLCSSRFRNRNTLPNLLVTLSAKNESDIFTTKALKCLKPGVPNLGYMYPLGYICLSEGGNLRLAIEGKNIFICCLFSNIYTYIT